VGWDGLTDHLLKTATRTFATSQAVSYTLKAGGAPTDLTGRAIFRDDHALLSLEGVTVETQAIQPKLGVRIADLPAGWGEGDVVVVGARTFAVATATRDGEGGVDLELEES